jgi:hypothetical protein
MADPTLTLAVATLVQLPLAPVTVKVVFDAGEAVKEVPVIFPGFHVKEVAPVAVRVAVPPGQIEDELAVTVGVVVTFTAVVAEPLQLAVLVPVTV